MIKQICVCGAGTMGAGIAQVSAQAGFDTIVYDVNKEALVKAHNQIDKSLHTLETKGKIKDGDREAISSRLRFSSDLNDCSAELFIEAIAEKLEIKISLFSELAKKNRESIFASNTSSLSITHIAKALPIPGNVAGMHFFNPAPVMKLVEVVATSYSSDHTIKLILEVVRKMEKTAAVCRDSPGFIVNRVARPYYIEALRMVEENLAGYSEIDELLEATGFKMGPFRLMDLIGNDINYAVSTSVYEQLGHPRRLQPSSIQEQKVIDGDLGKKTGRGYYDYR